MEKPGVAGAAFEHPLEGVAEDPLGRDRVVKPAQGGLDNGWGGTGAWGRLPPL